MPNFKLLNVFYLSQFMVCAVCVCVFKQILFLKNESSKFVTLRAWTFSFVRQTVLSTWQCSYPYFT